MLQDGDKTWTAEHMVGATKSAPEEILQGLHENLQGECSGVDTYLVMGCVVHREGCPGIGLYQRKTVLGKAEHTAKFAKLLDGVLTGSTKKNLEMHVDAENGVTMGRFELARKTRELSLDTIHNTVHETARGETCHGKAFGGLLKRCFG